jgi:hypothetical protein
MICTEPTLNAGNSDDNRTRLTLALVNKTSILIDTDA